MTSSITINPVLTTNALGSFNVSSEGYIQGAMLDDPVARYALAGGVLASTETLPMWGGVAISELIPGAAASPNPTQGTIVSRALTLSSQSAGQLTGFSVFNQAHAFVSSPQSPVPLASPSMSVNFLRMGSGARIAVAMDPSLISLEGQLITKNVSWDFVNQLLVPYLGTLTISSGTYDNVTGKVVLTMSAPITFSAGDAVIVSALTGTGAYASLDGTFTSIATTSGSTVSYNAGAGHGASTITGGSLTLGSGASSALPVKVLDVNAGNSMTVQYDPVTGFATWNRSGYAAIIQI